MHRFYIGSVADDVWSSGAEIDLPQRVSHQIRNVLRIADAENIVLFTGDGHEWSAEVHYPQSRGIDRSPVLARLIDRRTPHVEMGTKVSMAMALTRPQRYELALAKCAELGAYEFIPIISERVQKGDASIGTNRKARWERIVSEAAELSGRVVVPNITSPMSISDALSRFDTPRVRVVLLWERVSEPMLVDVLRAFCGEEDPPMHVVLVLGPVGGFSENEARSAVDQGAMPASLGARILRSETAALASMALAAQVLR